MKEVYKDAEVYVMEQPPTPDMPLSHYRVDMFLGCERLTITCGNVADPQTLESVKEVMYQILERMK